MGGPSFFTTPGEANGKSVKEKWCEREQNEGKRMGREAMMEGKGQPCVEEAEEWGEGCGAAVK